MTEVGLDTVQAVVRLAHDEKLPISAIARVLGVRRAVVRRVLEMTASEGARGYEVAARVRLGEVLR
jgi:hypothetical protein